MDALQTEQPGKHTVDGRNPIPDNCNIYIHISYNNYICTVAYVNIIYIYICKYIDYMKPSPKMFRFRISTGYRFSPEPFSCWPAVGREIRISGSPCKMIPIHIHMYIYIYIYIICDIIRFKKYLSHILHVCVYIYILYGHI